MSASPSLHPQECARQQLGLEETRLQSLTQPWLPFPWPLQISSWGWVYAAEPTLEVDWARAYLQASLAHPPIPLLRPRQISASADPLLLGFCWGVNRIVQGGLLDQQLHSCGYDPEASKATTLSQLLQAGPHLPEYARVLVLLELLAREISVDQQNQLKTVCSADEMKAAYQMNMMCIDPQDLDRTLLQVKLVGIKLCGSAEAVVKSGAETVLSDGRLI
ncbi:MAG: hypothetical protein HC921_16275 [Synechococcaceae cyanobacterium SM2_3_1]|nr:hypothetical protein [Synechococcaceae cyanobacterium SM2_3_1]